MCTRLDGRDKDIDVSASSCRAHSGFNIEAEWLGSDCELTTQLELIQPFIGSGPLGAQLSRLVFHRRYKRQKDGGVHTLLLKSLGRL